MIKVNLAVFPVIVSNRPCLARMLYSITARYLTKHLSNLVLHKGSFKKRREWLLVFLGFSKLKKIFKVFRTQIVQ